MWFEQVLFFVAAAGALGGAVGVVMLRNPFFSVLALVGHLLSLSVLFLLLRAEFLAAAQVVVYAGAVMVLYVFVVAYIGGVDEPIGVERTGVAKVGPLFALALLVEISVAVLGSGLSAIDGHGATSAPASARPARSGGCCSSASCSRSRRRRSCCSLRRWARSCSRAGRGLEEKPADELPEPAAQSPIPIGSGGPSSPGEDIPTRIPAGTAEGPGDPTVEQSPDHETQETPA